MKDVQEFVAPLIQNVERVIVGKRQATEFMVVALLCEGHVLLEDVPGLRKTMLARSFAASLGNSFRPVQCVPNLLHIDITGVTIFNQKSCRPLGSIVVRHLRDGDVNGFNDQKPLQG